MDRIINNESVAICAILSALVLDVDDIARLNLFVVMTTDRAIRNRLVNYANYEEMVGKESSYYQALNRKFVEFQPVFLNATTMLLMGGKVEKTAEAKYSLTNEGNQMAWEQPDGMGTSKLSRRCEGKCPTGSYSIGSYDWAKRYSDMV